MDLRKVRQTREAYHEALRNQFGFISGGELAALYIKNPHLRPIIEDYMSFGYAPQGATHRFSPRGVREFAEELHYAKREGKHRGIPAVNSWIRDLVELEKTGRTR